MRCGHCKEDHETVAEVRECSGAARPDDPDFAPKDRELTPRQQEFLGDLLAQFNLILERDYTTNTIPYSVGHPIITALVAARRNKATGKPFTFPPGVLINPHRKSGSRVPTQLKDLPDVPEGHYAIPSMTGNNDFDFFRVDRPTEGEYAGRIYVKRVIGGKPDQNIPRQMYRPVLEAIEDFGINDAGLLYGKELEQCRYCNRSLTKYASRQLSAGYHCSDKRGEGELWLAIQATRPEGED